MGNPVFLVEFTARVWPRFIRSGAVGANGTWYNSQSRIPINAAHTYTVKASARRSGFENGRFYMGVALFDAAGANINGDGAQWFYAASSVIPGASWTDYTGQFGSGTAKAFPGGAVTMAPLVILNYSSTGIGYMDCSGLWIEDDANAGVPVSKDPTTRDLSRWVLYGGSSGRVYTEPDVTPETLSLRFSTGAYVSASTDSPASTSYEARVLIPGKVRSEVPALCCGLVASSFGEIVLSNADGALSGWSDYAFSGCAVSVLMGRDDAARSTFVEVLSASVDQATTDHDIMRLRLRGRDSRLARPLLPNRYAGTNALPAGLEGTANDLIGQPKPRLFGVARNFAPPCVNTTRLIYQAHDPVAARAPSFRDELITVTAVRERGKVLTAGAQYTGQTDMETNAPAAGQYRVWVEGGYFRLGTAPDGLITCDAFRTASGPGGDTRQFGILVTELATDAGLTNIQAGLASIGGPNYMGFWIGEQTTYANAIQRAAEGAFAWVGYFNSAGLPGGSFEFGAQVFPRENVIAYEYSDFDSSSIKSLTAVVDPTMGGGIPAWRVELGYAINPNPILSDIDAAVSQADRAALAIPIRWVYAEAASALEMHPDARTLVHKTCLDDDATPTQVQAEADRLRNVFYRARRWFEVIVPMQAALDQATRPRLGGYVRITHPNIPPPSYSVDSQIWFECLVHAIELDLSKSTVRLTLRTD